MAGATTSSTSSTTSIMDLNPVAAITGFIKNDLFGSVSSGVTSSELKLPLPNPLHNYATYNYVISLYCLDADSYNFPAKSYLIGKLPPLICKSANADPTNRIQLVDGGKYDFYIDGLTIDGSAGFTPDSGNTTPTTLEFNVIEPYSMGMFIQVLQLAAAKQNYAVWYEAVFLLVIEFKGNTENGQMLSIPNTKKYIPIIFTKSNLKVDEKGSYWHMAATSSAGQALNDSYTKLKNEVSLVGKTVQELLQSGENSLQQVVNARYKEAVTLGTVKVADEILILFPVDISTTGATSSVTAPGGTENNTTATADTTKAQDETIFKSLGVSRSSTSSSLIQLSNTCNFIGKSKIDISSTISGTTPFKPDDLLWNEKAKVVDRSKTNKTQPECSFNFAQGSDIINAINQVIMKSEFAIDTMASNNLSPDGMRTQWKVDTQVYHISSNSNISKTGAVPKLIVYRIIPYEAHASNILAPNATAPGLAELKKQVVKEYSYMYSGKNVDLIKFDFEMSQSFFNLQMADLSQLTGDVESAKKTGDLVEIQKNNSSLNAPEGDSNVKLGSAVASTKYVNTVLSLDNKGGTSGDTVGSRAAKLFHDAMIKNLDMQQVTFEIIGDPYYISTSGLGNFTDTQLDKKNITKDGSANYQNGEVHININFRTPTDINQTTGLYNLKNSTLCHQFSGLFQLLRVQHRFKSGKFTQEIVANRMQGQDNTAPFKASSTLTSDKYSLVNTGLSPDLPPGIQTPGITNSFSSAISPKFNTSTSNQGYGLAGVTLTQGATNTFSSAVTPKLNTPTNTGL